MSQQKHTELKWVQYVPESSGTTSMLQRKPGPPRAAKEDHKPRACKECRRLHKRCSRGSPCSRCKRLGIVCTNDDEFGAALVSLSTAVRQPKMRLVHPTQPEPFQGYASSSAAMSPSETASPDSHNYDDALARALVTASCESSATGALVVDPSSYTASLKENHHVDSTWLSPLFQEYDHQASPLVVLPTLRFGIDKELAESPGGLAITPEEPRAAGIETSSRSLAATQSDSNVKSQVGVLVEDRSGQVLYFNGGLCEILGKTEQQVSQGNTNAFPLASWTQRLSMVKQALLGQVAFSWVSLDSILVREKQRDLIAIHSTIQCLPNGRGTVMFVKEAKFFSNSFEIDSMSFVAGEAFCGSPLETLVRDEQVVRAEGAYMASVIELLSQIQQAVN